MDNQTAEDVTDISRSNRADTFLKVKPKTVRGEETLARLCKAAEELFAEKNYYEASVSEISLHAGISIGAFYIYFNDKLSLYKYMVLQYGRRVRKYIAVRLAEKNLTSRYDLEREGLKLFLNFCVEYPHTFSLVWQSLFVAPEMFIGYYDDFGKQYEKQLGSAVRDGEIYPLNLEAVSYVLMGTINFLSLKYVTFGPPSGLSEEQLYRLIDEFMFILKNGLFINKPPDEPAGEPNTEE